jgi:quinoprotein glucose dehydrogenase
VEQALSRVHRDPLVINYVLGSMRMQILSSWLAVAAVISGLPASAQQGAKNGEWRSYGGDLGNTRYSPLDQIDATNFNKLEVAWRFKTDFLGPYPEYQFQSTPLR